MAIKMAKQNMFVQFAERDKNGKDIATATESFAMDGDDKVLKVNGIDIIDDTASQYGIYFKDSGGAEINVFQEGDKLHIDSSLVLESMLEVSGSYGNAGQVLTSNGPNVTPQWKDASGGTTLYRHIIKIKGNEYSEEVVAVIDNNSNSPLKPSFENGYYDFRQGGVSIPFFVLDGRTGDETKIASFFTQDGPSLYVFKNGYTTIVSIDASSFEFEVKSETIIAL